MYPTEIIGRKKWLENETFDFTHTFWGEIFALCRPKALNRADIVRIIKHTNSVIDYHDNIHRSKDYNKGRQCIIHGEIQF